MNHEPRTSFGRYMAYNFIPKHANKVNGLVYLGASLLIIVVYKFKHKFDLILS